MDKKPVIIALAGKGGVGKTSLAAAIVRVLSEEKPGKKLLAIDADPAVGLSTALGVEVRSTVDDIRKSFVSAAKEDAASAIELLGEAKYQIFDAMTEREDFSFLAIGRPESAGCYCKVNSFLKDLIGVVSGGFDTIVIDGEAGIEQVNRRVMETVTHLVLVSDASRKGLTVADTIREVAKELTMAEKTGLILNRVPDENIGVTSSIPILAVIGSDAHVARVDIEGRSVFDLPADSPVMEGARKALRNLEIL